MIVIKYGGNALPDQNTSDPVLEAIADAFLDGEQIVLVHGGGPQIDAALAEKGIGKNKVAGLLAQQIGDGLIVGIGLNVAMNGDELPVPTATSLALSGSNNLGRNTLLSDFLNRFESIFTEWESGSDFLEKYRQISLTIGRQVRVEVLGRDPIEAEAVAISTQGALILGDGFEVNVGDVVHLR